VHDRADRGDHRLRGVRLEDVAAHVDADVFDQLEVTRFHRGFALSPSVMLTRALAPITASQPAPAMSVSLKRAR